MTVTTKISEKILLGCKPCKLVMKNELPSTNLYDWKTDKVCETTKAVDVTAELGMPLGDDHLLLLYTEDRNGEIVQMRHGCSSLHYHTESIDREENADSALSNMAHWCGTTKKKLIEICIKHSPTIKP